MYRVLEKLEGKSPLWRPRRRWVNDIRIDLWGEVVYRFFVGKPQGESQLGRPRRTCVDNIRKDIRGEVGL